MDRADFGTYIEHDGRPAVRFVRTYPHSIDRVWAAVTNPDELRHWFPAEVVVDLRVGGIITFSGDPHADDQTGTVLACDPPRRLAFTWADDELHFELEPLGESACRFTLINVLHERDTAARNGAGWHVCLAELGKVVAGDRADGPHSASATPWQPLYDAYVAAGVPSGAEIPSPA
jgi:uncharacterized protein YndB with AHSA1/START domain